MVIEKWLTVSSNGGAKLSTNKPRMNVNEVAILLTLDIPQALFDRPRLEAKLKIPKEAVPSSVIATDVIDNVEKLIKQKTGLDLKISVSEPPAEEE